MFLALRKRVWPFFSLPINRGAVSVVDVVTIPPGVQRDQAIHGWCASVWRSFIDSQPLVRQLVLNLTDLR